MKKRNSLATVALLAAGVFCSSAFAQYEGSILIRGGVMQVKPKVESGSLSGPAPSNSTIDNGPSTKIGGGVTLMMTDHISIDLPLAPPFKFPINGTGAIQGVGKLGTVKSLPATQFVQYRFREPEAAFRPYIGLGITYAYFFDEEGSAAFSGVTNPGGTTRFKVKSKFALTPQIGATWMFSEPYFVDIWYAKTFLKTTATLSTGQTQNLVLNPRTLQISVGMAL
ncbi:MAG: OmpW family outer membrane protein [Pseudomonadota bacterium]